MKYLMCDRLMGVEWCLRWLLAGDGQSVSYQVAHSLPPHTNNNFSYFSPISSPFLRVSAPPYVQHGAPDDHFIHSGAVLGARSMSSWWRNVEPAAKDPILGVIEAFLADPSPNNVGLVSLP
ncbi:hypothetical protein ACH5RR_028511 [Cinchona calisaya]|uniref:Uncharacterized protein n=1 Tax=Cinchona calisaya TaxID=153742 RepID=A0ABD2YSX8_9GENT